MNPSHFFQLHSKLLGGPNFEHKKNLKYFVSILDYIICCYNPSFKEVLNAKLDSSEGCIFHVNMKRIKVASENIFFGVHFNTLKK